MYIYIYIYTQLNPLKGDISSMECAAPLFVCVCVCVCVAPGVFPRECAAPLKTPAATSFSRTLPPLRFFLICYIRLYMYIHIYTHGFLKHIHLIACSGVCGSAKKGCSKPFLGTVKCVASRVTEDRSFNFKSIHEEIRLLPGREPKV